ncbi:rRNA maturation RNase YbeY [Bartonella sp. M0280]|uniref:rRNA maturation RNase YbeY n=1 Tax=Bartonella apihabitans TaxID=2750929 RepID=UPI0018DD1DE7|nr:rRNA maturation RNase YbeY [Bartonella apihabitans]MBI0167824.1 rRNA maturation RNase YbeY [Bartonella apihabitans]
MTVHYDMAINADGWQNEETLRQLVDSVLQATLQELGFDKIDSELSLVFTNDADIREINGKWRHIDKPTNVLSFPAFALQPGQEPGEILGDIVIARETVAREAAEEHKSFDDHLSHLVVHGLLHLMGYDHQNDEEAEQMETLERKILASLGISDPYL